MKLVHRASYQAWENTVVIDGLEAQITQPCNPRGPDRGEVYGP